MVSAHGIAAVDRLADMVSSSLKAVIFENVINRLLGAGEFHVAIVAADEVGDGARLVPIMGALGRFGFGLLFQNGSINQRRPPVGNRVLGMDGKIVENSPLDLPGGDPFSLGGENMLDGLLKTVEGDLTIGAAELWIILAHVYSAKISKKGRLGEGVVRPAGPCGEIKNVPTSCRPRRASRDSSLNRQEQK